MDVRFSVVVVVVGKPLGIKSNDAVLVLPIKRRLAPSSLIVAGRSCSFDLPNEIGNGHFGRDSGYEVNMVGHAVQGEDTGAEASGFAADKFVNFSLSLWLDDRARLLRCPNKMVMQ